MRRPRLAAHSRGRARACPCRSRLPFPSGRRRACSSPAWSGCRHPVCSCPQASRTSLTRPQLEAVLAHELCHVRRRDNLAGDSHGGRSDCSGSIRWSGGLAPGWSRNASAPATKKCCAWAASRRFTRKHPQRLQALRRVAAPACPASRARISKKRIAAIMVNRVGLRSTSRAKPRSARGDPCDRPAARRRMLTASFRAAALGASPANASPPAARMPRQSSRRRRLEVRRCVHQAVPSGGDRPPTTAAIAGRRQERRRSMGRAGVTGLRGTGTARRWPS